MARALHMSAIGTKRTSICVASMSALEVKRAFKDLKVMSAFDSKRMWVGTRLIPS